MITAHASVPRWAAAAAPVDATGRTFGIVGDDGPVTASWAAQVQALGRPCWQVPFDGVDGALRGASVGLRVMITGPEHEVLATAARCRAAGLTDAELTLHAVSDLQRRVYCVHCTTTSLVRADVEDVATCTGCGRGLFVFAHTARRTGAYLGFQADAEEL